MQNNNSILIKNSIFVKDIIENIHKYSTIRNLAINISNSKYYIGLHILVQSRLCQKTIIIPFHFHEIYDIQVTFYLIYTNIILTHCINKSKIHTPLSYTSYFVIWNWEKTCFTASSQALLDILRVFCITCASVDKEYFQLQFKTLPLYQFIEKLNQFWMTYTEPDIEIFGTRVISYLHLLSSNFYLILISKHDV